MALHHETEIYASAMALAKFSVSAARQMPRDIKMLLGKSLFDEAAMTHKDFGHALLHVTKACGKLATVVNEAEHGGSEFKPEDVDRFVADLVVCALRMANTCPGRTIDLQRAIEDRIENKNQAELQRMPQ